MPLKNGTICTRCGKLMTAAFAANAGASAAPNHVKSAEKQGVICTTAFAAHAAAKQSRKKQNTI